jgi:hypothetical protein
MKYLSYILIIISFLFSSLAYSQLIHDFRVNDDTTNRVQRRALIGVADNGNFVIIWEDIDIIYGGSKDYFQRYNASGKPIGHNVMIQTPTTPRSHALTVMRDGSFVYSWNDTSKCYMRIYDSSGNASSSIIIASDTNKFTRFLYSQNSISLASDKNGNIIASMTYMILGYDTNYLYIQRFDKYGNKKKSNIRVNNFTANGIAPDHSVITTRNDGSFIIAWQGNIEIYGFDIFMQMFDSSGYKIGANRKVNDDTNLINFQYNPSISSDSIGNFIIVWEDPRITSGTWYSIWAQVYNPDGSLNGANFLVDFDNIGINDRTPKVSKRRDGNYIVGWSFMPEMQNIRKPQCQRYNNLNQKIGTIINIPKTAPDTAKYLNDFVLVGDKIISVWEDTRTGSDETRDIYCNILSFVKPDSIVGVTNISTEMPKEFKLYQNYPNPFNQCTIIKFQCTIKSLPQQVTLKIYDILGKEIATLVNEKQEPGTYEVSFNGSNLSTGIYFYTLLVDGIRIDTKKLVLIK